jgi:hypothetical protein
MKNFRMSLSALYDLYTTMLPSLRGLRKFLGQKWTPTSFLPRKNAGEDEGEGSSVWVNMLCSVAASARCVLRGGCFSTGNPE